MSEMTMASLKQCAHCSAYFPKGEPSEYCYTCCRLIQNTAERVCEVLAREVEDHLEKLDVIGADAYEIGKYRGAHECWEILTLPRDWTKELKEKK